VLEIRNAIPAAQSLASSDLSTIRLLLLKIALRIKEAASQVRLAFAVNCPDAAPLSGLVGTLILTPDVMGHSPCRILPINPSRLSGTV
jgi:hypothetical protein